MEDQEPGKAIPFVNVNVDGFFEVSNEAMSLVESWNKEKKLAIICIAGPYRSGKSYLANRILHQNSGFNVGSTTMACTKGIWMWNKPVHINNKVDAVLLDTEGLGSTERTTNTDIKIFSLSILLSSLFIYNCIGTISEYTLEDLDLVCNLTEHIHVNKSSIESGLEFRNFFPSFLWVLRDFYHQLDPGHTARDYMEKCLEPVPGISEDIRSKNKIREGIMKYFKDRDCVSLIRPLDDENDLAHIEEQTFDSLRPDFQGQMNKLIQKIYTKAKPKVISGKTLNGSMFLGLAMEYVDSLNNEKTPTIITALDRVVYAESNKIMDSLFEDLRTEVDKRADRKKFPIENEDLDEILSRIKEQFIERIHKQLSPILDVDEIIKNQNGFLDKFKYFSDEKRNENYTDSFLYNSSMLKNLMRWIPLDKLLDMEEASQEDGVNSSNIMIVEFWNSMFNVIEEYQKNCKGPAKFDTLAEFIIESNFVDEKKLINDNEKIDFRKEKKYFSYIIQFTQNLKDIYFAAQLERANISLSEVTTIDRNLREQKKKYEKKLELNSKEIEKLREEKFELELKIDQYERQKRTLDAEFNSNLKLSEMEIESKIKSSETELEENEKYVQSLKEERKKLKETNSELQVKINKIEKEILKETSELDSQIGKIDNDLEDVRIKVKEKQNNPKVDLTQKFFSDVKKYAIKYKEELGRGEHIKNLKIAYFDMQRQLNDKEFENSQAELKIKKSLNEELKEFKNKQENEIWQLEDEIEKGADTDLLNAIKGKTRQMQTEVDELLSKKTRLEAQINDHLHLAKENKKVIDQFNSNWETTRITERDLETKIYRMTGDIMMKMGEKDDLMMLLPEIILALKRQPNELKGKVQELTDSDTKRVVKGILIETFGPKLDKLP